MPSQVPPNSSIPATKLVALLTEAIGLHGDLPVYVCQEWLTSLDGLAVQEEGPDSPRDTAVHPKRIELY